MKGRTYVKCIYLVRHCEATGQGSECTLTNQGIIQARELTDFFRMIPIDRIISSPYKRAIESCKGIAKEKSIHIESDCRLIERILCKQEIPEWREKLYQSFCDRDVKLVGGESSNEAALRGCAVIEEVLRGEFNDTLIVTHGNLFTLLLNHFDKSYGYETWMQLTNPDVYHLTFNNNELYIRRIWKVSR